MIYIVSGIFLTRSRLCVFSLRNQISFECYGMLENSCEFTYLGSKSAEKTFNLDTFIVAYSAASIWAQHVHVRRARVNRFVVENLWLVGWMPIRTVFERFRCRTVRRFTWWRTVTNRTQSRSNFYCDWHSEMNREKKESIEQIVIWLFQLNRLT